MARHCRGRVSLKSLSSEGSSMEGVGAGRKEGEGSEKQAAASSRLQGPRREGGGGERMCRRLEMPLLLITLLFVASPVLGTRMDLSGD